MAVCRRFVNVRRGIFQNPSKPTKFSAGSWWKRRKEEPDGSSLGSLFVGRQTVYLQSVGAAHIGKALFLSDVPGDGLLRDALDDRRLSRSVGQLHQPVRQPGGIALPQQSGESPQPTSMLSGS